MGKRIQPPPTGVPRGYLSRLAVYKLFGVGKGGAARRAFRRYLERNGIVEQRFGRGPGTAYREDEVLRFASASSTKKPLAPEASGVKEHTGPA